jgi:hypothetical protein
MEGMDTHLQLCDGVGIGCTTKFHQNAKNVQIK